jgi:hypothetical protein
MAPFSYQAFYSSETGAALANTSGKARLVAPDGQIVSETAEYGTAADGQAWAWNGSSWQWTTSPSPSVVNTISAPTASKKSTAAKKTTAKKASSTKTTKPKVAKAKAVKGVKTTTPVLADTTDDGSGSGTGLQPWLLAGTGGLAVLYGAYEYRSDLANFLRKFRFYRRNRGESGAKS